MTTTYDDLRDGDRVDITVTSVTRRVFEVDGVRVCRLTVTDETGTQFPLLTAPDSDTPIHLRSGDQYRIHGLLGCDPHPTGATAAPACEACGSTLRRAQTIDGLAPAVTDVAARLETDGLVGIVDAHTTITHVDGDRVDDWRSRRTEPAPSPSTYVCEECDRHVEVAELGDRVPDDMLGSAGDVTLDAAPVESSVAKIDTLGLAAGGANGVANFRENVASGYTPQPDAISDEGLFADYYFETGESASSDALFAPKYAGAVSEHPLTGEVERYLSVGLDSTLAVEEFERPRLDLVAVIDVSGSMDSTFDQYYYDEHGRQRSVGGASATKLEAAAQSLCSLTEQLRDEDRLGVVLYNDRAHVAKPLRDVGATNMVAIRQHIREVAAGGGTNLADGFEAAWDLLADGQTDGEVERRVVFMTDMMPNRGRTGSAELTELFADAAAEGIHTTFVGMGLDANADLADALSGIRGANHYFVHSAAEFERRLGEEFAYVVTPLVYDLTLELDGGEVAAVHGSPSADPDDDRLVHVSTLFPSPKEGGEARGGVVLVRLDDESALADLELVASWTERDGSEHEQRCAVDLPAEPESFDHGGIRKAVVLARYARELRDWADDVHRRANGDGVDDWLLPDQRGEHERESVPLTVPDRFLGRFERLGAYLAAEMDVLDESNLEQEFTLLDRLVTEAVDASGEVSGR